MDSGFRPTKLDRIKSFRTAVRLGNVEYKVSFVDLFLGGQAMPRDFMQMSNIW